MALQLLKDSCNSVLADEEFCVDAVKLASFRGILETIETNCLSSNVSTASFSRWLYTALHSPLDASRSGNRVDREKLWTLFHQVRSTSEFDTKWKDFFTIFNVDAEPVLYQHLSLVYFKKIITSTLPIIQPICDTAIKDLTYEETNAITYIGGYLIKSISRELEGTSNPNLKFLMKSSCSGDGAMAEREEWLYTVDRGGLTYITESFSDTLASIEQVIRKELACAGGSSFDKDKLYQALVDDSDILFNWCLASTDVEDADEKTALFDLIAKKYITIRGFSFSKSILEKFKQEEHKGTQKSKPLRSKIADK